MLARTLCSISFRPIFSSMWIKKLYKLDFEKANEPEIKLPTFVRSCRKQGDSKKTSTSSLTMQKPLTVRITTNCGKLLEIGISEHLICLLRNLYASKEATVRPRHGTTDWFNVGKGVQQPGHWHPTYLTSMQSILCEMLGWMNHKLKSRLPEEIQYQQTHIGRWYHSHGRQWRGTKKPPDEG